MRKASPSSGSPQLLCTSAGFGHMSLFSPCYLQPDWRNPLKHLSISSSPADPSPGFTLWKYDPAKSSAWQNIRLMTSKCSESEVSWVLVRLNKPREALLEVIKWLRRQVLERGGLWVLPPTQPLDFEQFTPLFRTSVSSSVKWERKSIYLAMFDRRIQWLKHLAQSMVLVRAH